MEPWGHEQTRPLTGTPDRAGADRTATRRRIPASGPRHFAVRDRADLLGVAQWAPTVPAREGADVSDTLRWWQQLFAGLEGVAYGAFHHRPAQRGTRPALLMIDIVESFVGPREASLEEAIQAWPTACGPFAREALPHVADLLAIARAARLPVVHTAPSGPRARWLGPTVKGELDGDFVTGRPGAIDFVPEAAPAEDELVIHKPRASAFFNTPVATYLHSLGIDSVIVGGATTSGCVRASVVDAFSHGFDVFVVEEAVFDRSRLSAAVSLYEMNAKYADVLALAEVESWVSGLSAVS
jgi:maleamate amidohydrolase